MSFGASITLNDGTDDHVFNDVASSGANESAFRESSIESKYGHMLKIRQTVDLSKADQKNRHNVLLTRTEYNTEETEAREAAVSFSISRHKLFTDDEIVEMALMMADFITESNINSLLLGEI
jgi:SRSO17 transposase